MKFFPIFLSLLFPLPTVAQDAQVLTVQQILDQCRDQWGDRTSAVAQCVTSLRLAAGESRDRQIVARLGEGEERDGEILERIDALDKKVDKLASRPTQATQPAPTAPVVQTAPTTSVGGVIYGRTAVVNWTPVVQPTVVSIHSLTGMVPDTLHLTDLDHPTARRDCGGVGAPLVVFFDHGVPVGNIFAPAGAPTGFVEVYWDRQNDGTPDGTVWALDLASQSDVWITWGLKNDLTIRYLRPGGQIAVQGLPLQTVYHPTVRAEASASGSIGCKRWDGARRGGHQTISAGSLEQIW